MHATKEMRWHYIEWPNEEDVLCHFVDGKSWKDFNMKFLNFS